MMVLLVVYQDSSSSTLSLILGISIALMFVLFYLSLKVIGGRQESKLKELVHRMKAEHEGIQPKDIAEELKVDKEKIQKYM
jgi:hypothetical protein